MEPTVLNTQRLNDKNQRAECLAWYTVNYKNEPLIQKLMGQPLRFSG